MKSFGRYRSKRVKYDLLLSWGVMCVVVPYRLLESCYLFLSWTVTKFCSFFFSKSEFNIKAIEI